MSVSLREVIEAGGYDLSTFEDAQWLKSKEAEWERLLEEVETLIHDTEDREMEESEREYRELFPEEDDDDDKN